MKRKVITYSISRLRDIYLLNDKVLTKTKERGEVEGSTRKIKKQKGTGTARAGSIKSPIFRGGGRVFGPRPRNYTIHLNKQARRLARRTRTWREARVRRVSYTYRAECLII